MLEIERARTVTAMRGAAFAGALLLPSILVLTYGLTASSGNSLATGAAIAGVLTALAVSALPQPIRLNVTDLAFVALVASAAVSIAAASATRHETIALALTLASYLAARNLSVADLPALRTAVTLAAGIITAIGTSLMALALVEQWNDPHGHPIVLGLPSAATMLAITSGYLAIAAATDQLDRRRLCAWSAALFLPVVVMAASQIRFALIATVGAVLVAAATTSCRRQRRGALVLALTILVAAACGLAVRHQTSTKFMRQFEAVTDGAIALAIPTAAAASNYVPASDARIACGIETDNSLAIRKFLIGEALGLVRQAGPLGLGLDGFLQRSCLGMAPHNVNLQTLIELGWIGGGALALLMVATAFRLVPLARQNPAATFLLCALAYASALSMVHGRLSRQGDLFLLLGAGAGVLASCGQAHKVSWPVKAGSKER